VGAAAEGAPTVHLIAQCGGGFADALRRLGIGPEIRRGYLFVKFFELGCLGGEVKDAPGVGGWFPVR
jgi:hypothetical protein